MKEGKKPEYLEKTPDDELQERTMTLVSADQVAGNVWVSRMLQEISL